MPFYDMAKYHIASLILVHSTKGGTMAQLTSSDLQATWLKLLKAEVKHKRKKAHKLERKLIRMELEKNKS